MKQRRLRRPCYSIAVLMDETGPSDSGTSAEPSVVRKGQLPQEKETYHARKPTAYVPSTRRHLFRY
jgi:hypothetical protein